MSDTESDFSDGTPVQVKPRCVLCYVAEVTPSDVVLDLRSEEERARHGVIPGSVFEPSTPGVTVVYCQYGSVRSPNYAQEHPSVKVLLGGYVGWRDRQARVERRGRA